MAQVPWPDAFEPRPNWRRPKAARSWSWLLLVPLGILVAVVVATVDTRALRDFIDLHLLHRQPKQESETTSLLPAPFRTGPATPPASPSATPAPTPAPAPAIAVPPAAGPSGAPPSLPFTPAAPSTPVTSPQAGSPLPQSATPPEPVPPAAAPAPAADVSPPVGADPSNDNASLAAVVPPSAPADPPPIPSLPIPPVPVPPPATPPAAESTAGAPAAAAGPATQAVPSIARVTVSYRRNQPDAEAQARRIAARIGAKAGTVDLRPTGSTYRSPTIHYYHPGDKEAALALARSLAGEGGNGWVVRAGPSRPAGSVDIWVP